MKSSKLLRAVAIWGASMALAYPGMGETLEEIKRAEIEGRDSDSLIGDLATLPDNELTSTGKNIKKIITGAGSPQDLGTKYNSVPAKGSDACNKDTCCIWKYIADEMRDAMVGTAGRCNNFARAAIRLGFHDAGTWSLSTGDAGGADGSVVLAGECEDRRENSGMGEICALVRTWHDKYKQYGVGMADLIQMAANVGTVSCPLGPRVRSYVGRKDRSGPAPEDNLPSPFGTADELIAMFEDKTISPAGLIALLGAHTVSQQRFIVEERAGDPQDSTPGVWDSLYYRETVDPNAPQRVMKLESDVNLSKDPRTSPTWNKFSSALVGQLTWNDVSSPALPLYARCVLTLTKGVRSRVRSLEPSRRKQHQRLDRLHQGTTFIHGLVQQPR